MKGYIRFSVSSGEIGASVSLAKRDVYRLKNNFTVYHALLHNNVSVVVTSEAARVVSGMKSQRVTIYDMPALVSYKRTCAFIFRLFTSDKTVSMFEIAVVADNKESLFGHLKVYTDGTILFDNEPVAFVKTNVLLTKCIMRGK